MEFFNHVQKVYSETDHDTLNLDIPLAIFMIKLLSIKVDFSHFRDENKFNEYILDKTVSYVLVNLRVFILQYY